MPAVGRARVHRAVAGVAAIAAVLALAVARAGTAPHDPQSTTLAGETITPPLHVRARHTEPTVTPPLAGPMPELPATAASPFTNTPVNDPTGETFGTGNTQMEPSVAAHGDTLVCGFTDSRGLWGSGSASGYAWSLDGGTTWTDGGSVPNPAPPMLVFGDPTVVTDFQGRWFYVSALDRGNGSNGQGTGGLSVALHRGRFLGTSLVWDPPIIVAGTSTERLDSAHLAIDPDRDRLYVAFTNVTEPAFTTGQIEVVTLDQHGTNVLQRVVVQPLVSGVNQNGTRIAVGPNGEVYCAFQGAVTSGTDGQGPGTQKIARSLDLGATFSTPVVAASVVESWLSGPPGANREEESVEYPSLAVDRSNGPHRGRVYLAWHDAVHRDFSGSLSAVNETTAPNNAPQDAQVLGAVPAGTAGWHIAGGLWSADGSDWFRFSGQAGDHMRMVVTPVNALAELRLVLRWPNAAGGGADTTLAASWRGPGYQVFFLFTLPASGDYLVGLFRIGSAGTSYNAYLRRAAGTWSSTAIDHRDVVLVSSPDGVGGWSPKVRVHEDMGYTDQAYPEVVVDGAGGVHVSWYDRRWDRRTRALADVALSSSFDGGATFVPAARITTGPSYWQVSADAVPNFGDQFRPVAEGDRLHMVWADGRGGDPDVRFAPLGTGFDVALPESAQAIPGQALGVAGTIHNRTPYGDAMFTVQVDPSAPGLPDTTLMIGPVESGEEVSFAYDPVVGSGVQGPVPIAFAIVCDRSAVVREHIVIAHNDAVPVWLHDFTAFAPGRGVRLEWRSSPGARFDVERAEAFAGPYLPVTVEPVTVDARGYGAFDDATASAGSAWFYRLAAAGDDGSTRLFGPYRVETAAPARLALLGAVPNPFNPSTEIRFALPRAAATTLHVVDARGRRVAVLLDRALRKPGTHAVAWDGRDGHGVACASGVYWAELVVAGERTTTRLVLVR